MKRLFVAAIACGVWLTGVTSAGALTYVLDHGRAPPATAFASYQPRHAGELTENATTADDDLAVRALVSEPVSRMAPAPRARPVEPPPPRDISEMVCAPARELDMGSGHVQICE